MFVIHGLSLFAVVVYGMVAIVVEDDGLSDCFVFLTVYSALNWVLAYVLASRYKEQCNVYQK